MAFEKDPTDPRVFIPRPGGGVTLNYAHGISWAIFLSMTVIPLAVVIGTTVLLLL
ncbi:peptide ABC transporter substrate-binding protein [Actinoplanes sp. NPDC049265]|uniref:peptide ABC transporter substrate-binding protein n=1 Tax=Actinoplanes sp. NPDC049265 TaxID=3363902 RepID=UPI003717B04A